MTYLPPCCWSGSLYIRSSMISSHTARRRRAPVSRFSARSAISRSAPGVNSSSRAFHAEELLVLLHQRVLRLGEDVDQRCRHPAARASPRSAAGRRTRGSCRIRSGLPAAPAPALRARSRADFDRRSPRTSKPICRLPSRLRMMSSSPTNVPPQMNRICVVSIWMYCCSGCLRPPCGGMLPTVPSSIFSSACCTPSPRHVARDDDVVLGLADLVDLVDVDDAALRRFQVVVRVLQQLEQDVLDVLADVAGFGQRGRVADRERHVEDPRQRLGQQRLARAGRPDQQHVALVDLDVVRGLRSLRSASARACSAACSDCAPRPTAPSWRSPARSRTDRGIP